MMEMLYVFGKVMRGWVMQMIKGEESKPPIKISSIKSEEEQEQEQEQEREEQEREEQEEEDRISSLPDCLLVDLIISRLPETKYAIRTGTLSKRWQHLWLQHPNLNISRPSKRSVPQFYSSLERVISQYHNLRKFKLHAFYIDRTKLQVRNCIRNAMNHNIQEFDLYVPLYPFISHDDGFRLPEFFFISSSFIHVTLHDCMFEQAGIISWKNLKSLSISYGYLDEDVIEDILSGSPVLETLELACCFGFKRIDITSKSVKNLALFGNSDQWHMQMVEINAPYILSLAFKEYSLLQELVLLNVSSVRKVELDFSKNERHQPQEMYEEMLKGLILRLGHVKEVKIGKRCLKALARLKVKGFIFPSNLKILEEIDSNVE